MMETDHQRRRGARRGGARRLLPMATVALLGITAVPAGAVGPTDAATGAGGASDSANAAGRTAPPASVESSARQPAAVQQAAVQQGSRPVAQQQQQPEQELAPTMLVLDASGSMLEDDPSGGTRIAAAKDALTGLVDEVPAEAELGLMAYGTAKGKAKNDLELGCKDIETLHEVGPIDKTALTNTVNDIEPGGFTPVGASLRKAAEELPAEGPRAVILVSDGEDTCAPPPPCKVAKDLAEQGVDLTMHTVGYQVGDKARRQLECIAEAGGGTYLDAPDGDTLREKLPEVAVRAMRDYKLEGKPITGTEDQANAPEFGPGQWVDKIDAGQTKYYRLDIPKNYYAHVASTLVVPEDEVGWGSVTAMRLTVRIVDKRGVVCAETTRQYGDKLRAPTQSLGWKNTSDASCDTNGPTFVEVTREGPDGTKFWTYDMEMQVILEPPVTGDGGPDANETAVAFESPGGPKQEVVGGGGFNDAAELSGSGTYTDTLRYGEMATYKVKVDWGESLAIRGHLGELPEHAGHAEYVSFQVDMFEPNRMQDTYWELYQSTQQEPISLDPIVTPRVLYNNREGSETYYAGYPSIAGWYYVTMQLSSLDSPDEVPVELEVNVGGEKIDPPQYAKVPGAPPGPLTEEPDPTPKPEKDEDAKDGGKPEDGQDSGDQQPAAADAPLGGPLPWVLVAAGTALVLGTALIGWRFRARRANAHGGTDWPGPPSGGGPAHPGGGPVPPAPYAPPAPPPNAPPGGPPPSGPPPGGQPGPGSPPNGPGSPPNGPGPGGSAPPGGGAPGQPPRGGQPPRPPG